MHTASQYVLYSGSQPAQYQRSSFFPLDGRRQQISWVLERRQRRGWKDSVSVRNIRCDCLVRRGKKLGWVVGGGMPSRQGEFGPVTRSLTELRGEREEKLKKGNGYETISARQ
jgi:hypothetical protein